MIFDLFSEREKALKGEGPEVYIHGNLSDKLRAQIIFIWHDVLGDEDDLIYRSKVESAYKRITDTICEAYGILQLPIDDKFRYRGYMVQLSAYFMSVEEIAQQLDVVEVSFRYIDTEIRNYDYLRKGDSSKRADGAIDKLNERFKQHRIGFQFVGGQIIRMDSELIHSEVVEPTITLLKENEYEGAQQEFQRSLEHYRHGRHKESLNECLKSFESTMKAICDKREWYYDDNATAKKLIKVCLDNELVSPFWQDHFSSLRKMLESGIPTARNKLSAHGQGTTPTEVSGYLVSYVLHITASTILFLVKAENDLH